MSAHLPSTPVSDRATHIPFGPYLAVAGWLQLVLAPDLLGAYLRWAGMA